MSTEAQGLSREFLEEVWGIARKQLPGWVFAALRTEARSRAGGRARHRTDEPTSIEKLAITQIKPDTLARASDDEVREVWLRLHQWFANAVKQRRATEDFINAAVWVLDEFKRRGFEASDSPLKEEAEKLRSVRKEKGIVGRLEKLPRDLVVVRDFICLVGSAAKGKEDPNDIDLLVRAPRQEDDCLVQLENIWLPIRNVMDPEKRDLLSFIWNAQGAHGTHFPLYDLVLRKKDQIEQTIVKADKPRSAQGLTALDTQERTKSQRRAYYKTEAQYREGIDGGSAPCILCAFYQRSGLSEYPGPETSSCQVVEGSVNPFGTCTLHINALAQAKATQQATEAGTLKVDLGCGDAKPDGFFGIDIKPGPSVDKVANLEWGIPLASNSAAVIRASHVLEHLMDKEHVMREIHRVLRPGGELVFEVPSTKGEGAFAHPGHRSFWNKSAFLFWVQDELREDRPRFNIKELEEVTQGDLTYVRGTLVKPEQVQKALAPGQRFIPPKPAMAGTTELFEVEDLWSWAKDKLPIAVEPKHNGFRAVVNKAGERVSVWFEGQIGKDLSARFPELVEAVRKLEGNLVLDADVGMERGGKRVPRIDLMRLNSDKPELRPGERVVLTVFDAPYTGEDLTGKPFKERRQELERVLGQGSDLIRTSPLRWVNSVEELRSAARWAFGHDRSEGLVAKTARGTYETDGSTNEWSKLKRVAEIKVIVLKVQTTKAGDFNYWGGLLPGGSDWENTTELNGHEYVNLGKTFNTNLKAKVGDILTVQVLELIPNEEARSLAWLGPMVIDIDTTRSQPYLADQAIDVTRRANVLQKSTQQVPTKGPKGAPVAFVGASPGRFELARREPLVGPAGETFNDVYLKPLGLSRDQVVLANVVPELLLEGDGRVREPNDQEVAEHREALLAELRDLSPRIVVALGRTAQTALGEAVDFTLPHPSAVRRFGDRGEVARKLKRIKEAISSSVAKQHPRGLEEGGEDTRGAAANDDWFENWQDYLPKSGKGRFVYQHHWRGIPEEDLGKTDAQLLDTGHSVHGDLRLQGEDGLWGWAVLIGSAADNKAAGGDKLLGMKPGQPEKLRLAAKLHQPEAWLDVGVGKPLVAEPGGAGATSQTSAKFFALDRGTYQLGVARRSAIEIFLDGEHVKGRYLLQLAEFPGEGGAQARRVWLIDKPEDQTPMAERRDLGDVIAELRQKQQRFLIWAKPGEKPQLIDVKTGDVLKASIRVPILKADPEKRIVYGAVLDPYGDNGPEEDAHADWMPPGEVEKTAHAFMQGPRTVGLQHEKTADAKVVESWVEQYPTREDYLAAMKLQPHKVWERPFGSDKVHSGSWCMGVELGPKEWELFKAGELNAFSPGGVGMRTPMSRSIMPRVTYVELVARPV